MKEFERPGRESSRWNSVAAELRGCLFIAEFESRVFGLQPNVFLNGGAAGIFSGTVFHCVGP